MADINGDGRADIIGFGNAGTYTALALGNGGFAAAGGHRGLGVDRSHGSISIHDSLPTSTGDRPARP
jgi:hypothetical protein